MRWEKNEERLPKSMVELTAGEVHFTKRHIDAKDPNWAIEVRTRGTKRSSRSEDRRGRRKVADMGQRMRSERYFAARPRWALRTKMRTLNDNPKSFIITNATQSLTHTLVSIMSIEMWNGSDKRRGYGSDSVRFTSLSRLLLQFTATSW